MPNFFFFEVTDSVNISDNGIITNDSNILRIKPEIDIDLKK
ncbi:MAG: hypothetical protein OEM28_03655 [Nitrosopumilus sp.]|nr:hypothetical protein [Nitrosopumilus sp.]MDH3487545.1 hypothetical protein [Nitrosopumilus sp.]